MLKIIEKKRRDRINQCLMELKRLVPAALEKQGSTKLEKAEILKMTVDHLKMTQSTSTPNNDKKTYKSVMQQQDTTSVNVDYKLVGYHECASEVARYLTTYEGLGSQDPLCVRLLSHLNYYVAQQQQKHQHHQQQPPKPHLIPGSKKSSLLSMATTSVGNHLPGLNYWNQPPSRPLPNRPYLHHQQHLNSNNSMQHSEFSSASLAHSYFPSVTTTTKNSNVNDIFIQFVGTNVPSNQNDVGNKIQSTDFKSETLEFELDNRNKSASANVSNISEAKTLNNFNNNGKKIDETFQPLQSANCSLLNLHDTTPLINNNFFSSNILNNKDSHSIQNNNNENNFFQQSQSIPQYHYGPATYLFSSPPPPSSSSSSSSSSSIFQYLKPYRPWGAQLALY